MTFTAVLLAIRHYDITGLLHCSEALATVGGRTASSDGLFFVGIVAVFAARLFAAALRSVNRAPAVPAALVTIWIESITSSCTSSVSQTTNFSL